MDTQRFMYVPLFVDGVQVTAENMAEVAEWCEGKIDNTIIKGKNQPFIKVDVLRPISLRQTRAFVGDWVLKIANGKLRVYTQKALVKDFIPAAEVTNALAEKIGKELFVEPPRETPAERLITEIFQEPATVSAA
jgi:hypothetical protein